MAGGPARPVIVASSSANDSPAGSPAIVMLAMPPADVTWIRSFGLLPAIHESASLSENWDVAAATCVMAALKARTVSGSEYVKYPLKL